MLKFLLFFIIGLLLYPVFCFIFVFVKVFFGTNSILKRLEEKVTILAYDYKVYSLRKEYAEKNSIGYTTPFEFKYSDDKVKIETESLSQLEFLNKLQNLEKDIDTIEEALDDRLKTNEPAVTYLNAFYDLKAKIREANPYVY
jgi:hypothetical protein